MSQIHLDNQHSIRKRDMLHLRSSRDTCLGHPASFLSRGCESSLIVASQEGQVSKLSPELSVIVPHRTHEGDVRACSAHPSKPMLAIVDEEGRRLRIVGFDGSSIFVGHAPGEITFEGCFFDPGGTRLWCLLESVPQAIVECRDIDNWSVIDTLGIENETGDGPPRFEYRGPNLGLLFCPQFEGGRVYWLDPGSSTEPPRIIREPSLDDIDAAAPPVFSPDGSEFLVVDQHRVVYQFAYPNRQLGTSLLQPTDADYFSPLASYLSPKLALVGSGNGRIMLLELDSMRVVSEIAVEGHEPRPMNEYFPEMGDFRELATDISSIHRVNDWLYCVHKSEDARYGVWGRDKYSVWCISVDSALAQLGY
jgi:hypothetical protein